MVLTAGGWLDGVGAVAAGQQPVAAVIPFVPVDVKEPLVFDRNVFPILAEKCTTCHDAEGGLAEGGLDLLTVEAMKRGGKHGPALVPMKGNDSLLVQLAAHRRKPFMPPKKEPPLSPRELSIIKLWIDQGARPGSDLQPAKSLAATVELGALPASVQPVYALDLDPAGRRLAAGRANQVVVYDLETGRECAQLGGHQDIVQSIRWSPDGTLLAAGGYQLVKLWRAPPLPSKSAAPPPGKAAKPATGKRAPQSLTIRPKEDWREAGELGPFAGRVIALDFSPDGKQLATGGGLPAGAGELMFWDVAGLKTARVFPDAHSDAVFGVAFSPDGKLLASAGGDKFVKVFEVASGKRVRSFEGHTEHVLAVQWKPDGKQLASASADTSIKVWSLETGEQVRTISGHGKQVTGLAWPRRGNLFGSSCGDRAVRLFDSEGRAQRTLPGNADFLYCIDLSDDGRIAAAGSHDGKILVWETNSGKLLHTFGSPAPTAKK